MQGRNFGNLPTLFQDVFTVARRLGVKYVWIDSICIIQDDDIDWQAEAPNMGTYYEQSSLTIARTEDKPGSGLFTELPAGQEPWSRLIRLPYTAPDGVRKGSFYVYHRKPNLSTDYLRTIGNATLLKRGWVVQEWLLSKRFLWYTSSGLYFICRSNNPRTAHHEVLHFDNRERQPDLELLLSSSKSFFSELPPMDAWYRVVELYSQAALTKPEKDRLFALSGMARILQEKLRALSQSGNDSGLIGASSAFLSGTWLCDLHYGLLWEAHRVSKSPERMKTAASWSWTSFLASVRWPKRDPKTKLGFKIDGVCSKRRGPHSTPEIAISGVPPQFQAGKSAQFDGTEPRAYDKDKLFFCLHLQGKIYPVHIRGYLSADHLKVLSEMYHESPDVSQIGNPEAINFMPRLRAVCSPFQPELIAGFACLDDMEDDTACADYGIGTLALHISSHHAEYPDGKHLRVLFLKANKDQPYSRLGVGKIVDPELARNIEARNFEAVQLA
jgi:hypothetical protein